MEDAVWLLTIIGATAIICICLILIVESAVFLIVNACPSVVRAVRKFINRKKE